MPYSAIELASGILQSDEFQLITLVARRCLIAVVLGGRRYLVNGKRTGVLNDVWRSRAVLCSAWLEAGVPSSVSPHTTSVSLFSV